MTAEAEPQWRQVEISGERFPWAIVDGMVQVRLPFRVDRRKLTLALHKEGYHVSNGVEETDAQGWGPDYDAEGYYPYWVFPDEQPEWTVFSFPPEDYDETPDGTTEAAGHDHARGAADKDDEPAFRPCLGRLSQEELARWLGQLKAARL